MRLRKTWLVFLVTSTPVPALWLALNWLHEGDAILALRGSMKAAVVINVGAFVTYVGFFAAILALTSLCLRHMSVNTYRSPLIHGVLVAIAAAAAATIPWALTGVQFEWTAFFWLVPQLALWLGAATWLSQAERVSSRQRSRQQGRSRAESASGRTYGSWTP